MSSTNQLDTTTIVFLILGAIIVLPLLTLGMGSGGMTGYGGMMGDPEVPMAGGHLSG